MNTQRRPILAAGTLPARARRSKQSSLICSIFAASFRPTVSRPAAADIPYPFPFYPAHSCVIVELSRRTLCVLASGSAASPLRVAIAL
jgi:hypothetical protein